MHCHMNDLVGEMIFTLSGLTLVVVFLIWIRGSPLLHHLQTWRLESSAVKCLYRMLCPFPKDTVKAVRCTTVRTWICPDSVLKSCLTVFNRCCNEQWKPHIQSSTSVGQNNVLVCYYLLNALIMIPSIVATISQLVNQRIVNCCHFSRKKRQHLPVPAS